MTMKLLLLTTVLASCYANEAVFTPQRISYNAMVEDSSFQTVQETFLKALQQDGIVSVTGIPNLHKEGMLKTLHDCSLHSKTTQEHVYGDGTRRRTMATHSVPGGVQLMHHSTESGDCKAFDEASTHFRKTVGEVTKLFSQRLASLLDQDGPLLATQEGYKFETVEHVVEAGEHLEHFHSYQKLGEGEQEEDTIDIHTDQGLLLVFSPALLVAQQQVVETLQDGFYVELSDGSRAKVHFSNKDDLVFMLGDGVNQYINPSITNNVKLRATPHAVSMPSTHGEDQARVWYGRMVLPPYDAIHPSHGMAFGELRESNIQGEHKDLACSSNKVARQLEEISCETDTLFCWEKCMSPAEYNVSESICQEQGLNLACTNEERQLYVSGHGQFFPGCIDIANAEEVYGNPVHSSQQNTTNHTSDNGDGDHGEHDGHDHGTSGAAFAPYGSFVAVTVAAIVGFVM